MESASGGVFSALATTVVEAGGVVFGAEYADSGVRHAWTDNIDEVSRFRGSKYVQSNLGSAFTDVLGFLEQGRTVLFSGTPCQVAGLLSYLAAMRANDKELDLLYTVDFVCHGVGSPEAFRLYLQEKQASGISIEKLNMRSKRFGYRSSSMELVSKDGTKRYIATKMDDYLDAFYSNLILRPSCHSCGFKSARHASDLTLWDSWHAEETLGMRRDNKGFTNIAVQSEKGLRILGAARRDLETWDVSVRGDSSCRGGMMLFSTKPHPEREEFMEHMREEGLASAMQRFAPKGALDKVKEAVRPLLHACGLLDRLKGIGKARVAR